MNSVRSPETWFAIRKRTWAAVLIAGVLTIASCGASSDDSDPEAVIRGWVDAYNAGQIDELLGYYADDAVVTDHPFAARAEGSAQLRTLAIADVASSDKNGTSYEIRNFTATDSSIVWDHTWHSADGRTCTAEGNEVTVEDGKIVSWVFPRETIVCTED